MEKRRKVGFFAVLGLVGLLADELTKAAEDGKITVSEGLKILKAICERLGIDFDTTGIKIDVEGQPE